MMIILFNYRRQSKAKKSRMKNILQLFYKQNLTFAFVKNRALKCVFLQTKSNIISFATFGHDF